jgi:hypothetical protein
MRLSPAPARAVASATGETSTTVTSVNPAAASWPASGEAPPPASTTALSFPAMPAAASLISRSESRGSAWYQLTRCAPRPVYTPSQCS